MNTRKRRITVLGGGAWGTALAVTMARAGHETTLWARDSGTVEEINTEQSNRRYLPAITLDAPVQATTQAHDALDEADIVLVVLPAQSLRSALEQFSGYIATGTPLVLCTKGIERKTGKLMSEVVRDICPENPAGALSGPSFASDVARGLPTAVTLACEDEAMATELASTLSAPALRCYSTTDLVGVEIGGALKNVLAIAAGSVRGAGLGASAQAATITRGFVELRRIGAAMGANPETMMGLSGLGDLILTCSSDQSRNYAYGLALGKGENLENRPLAEGVATAGIAARLARENNIETPICNAIAAVLDGEVTIHQAMSALLARPLKTENA